MNEKKRSNWRRITDFSPRKKERRNRDAKKQEGIAVRKQQEAQKEADKAKKARDFLVGIFELSDANGQRGTMTSRQVLDDAEKTILKDFADQPECKKIC